MSEYHYILSLYQKHKQYRLKVIPFSAVLIALAGFFVALNLVRVSPLLIFAVALAGALYYALHSQTESKNYEKVRSFLNANEPDSLKNEELVFFIDYQMNNYFGQESEKLFDCLNDDSNSNDEKAAKRLKTIVFEIKGYYDYLMENIDRKEDEDMEVSLDWYKKTIENRKNDLV